MAATNRKPETLIQELKDRSPVVRQAAAQGLAGAGAGIAGVANLLVDALHDPDEGFRIEVARVLAEIGAPAVPALLTGLEDADPAVRDGVSFALGNLGAAACDAVPVLVAALADRDEMVRWMAAHVLGQLGDAAREAAPALVRALRDGNDGVRLRAARALGAIRPPGPEAAAALERAATDRNLSVRIAASEACARLRSATG